MAYRSTQRRVLAGTDPKKESLMEPTNLRKQPPPPPPQSSTRPIKIPDPIPSSNLYNNKYLSKSLDSCQSHKIRTTQKPVISQKAFFSLVGYGGTDKPKRGNEEEGLEKSHDKVVCSKGFGEDGEKKKKTTKNQQQLGGGDLRNSVSSLPVVVPSSGGGGRRKSLGGTRQVVELADVFAANGVKVVSVDMPPFMQIHAVELARKVHDSLEKFTSKTLASTLKKEFDGIYGPAWHCIVGTSFGSFVTHSVGGFLYFSMDQKLYILLFKTTVQRAD